MNPPWNRCTSQSSSCSRIENCDESLAEMCGGSEAGSYSRLIDCVYHSPLGLRVICKKEEEVRRFKCKHRQSTRLVDVTLPGKENPTCHRAKPVHQIISMIKWIRTCRLSIQNLLFNSTQCTVHTPGYHMAKTERLSVTLSVGVGTPIYPYSIAYR